MVQLDSGGSACHLQDGRVFCRPGALWHQVHLLCQVSSMAQLQ
jgi:hypothetical protein